MFSLFQYAVEDEAVEEFFPQSCVVSSQRRSTRTDIEYVGQTNDFRRRTREYVADGTLRPGDRIEYISIKRDCTKQDLNRAEQEHIKRHNTNVSGANKSRGGEGPQWKDPILKSIRRSS